MTNLKRKDVENAIDECADKKLRYFMTGGCYGQPKEIIHQEEVFIANKCKLVKNIMALQDKEEILIWDDPMDYNYYYRTADGEYIKMGSKKEGIIEPEWMKGIRYLYLRLAQERGFQPVDKLCSITDVGGYHELISFVSDLLEDLGSKCLCKMGAVLARNRSGNMIKGAINGITYWRL